MPTYVTSTPSHGSRRYVQTVPSHGSRHHSGGGYPVAYTTSSHSNHGHGHGQYYATVPSHRSHRSDRARHSSSRTPPVVYAHVSSFSHEHILFYLPN
jgi:hypothetical protein